MDPLTALGLASNVFSFVSFATGLVQGTLEISASVHGCSIDTAKLNTTCNQLQELCDGLKSCAEHEIIRADAQDDVAKIFAAVKRLCVECRSDGDGLLRIVNKLKTKNGSTGKWDSFRVALKTAWEKSSIDELETRLSRTQTTLTLHICTLAHYCSRSQSGRLEALQQRSLLLQADQVKAFDGISAGLASLEDKLRRLKSVSETAYLRDQQDRVDKDDVDCLQGIFQTLSLSGKNLEKQQAILESLTFDSRPVRHSQIVTAHEETFKWALETTQDPSLGPGLGNWLQRGDGIFWVSGKPGSGKSTLMKYIAESPVSACLVSEWAAPCRAVIASHYFWITGTYMQKSQQGLLQSLLYEIFRQFPDEIEQICEERWNSPQSTAPWSLSELRQALETFAKKNLARLKFCFIIDGMDEYSGDHEDRIQLCRTFKNLAQAGNIKLCLSSRPWNVFEEEFGLEYPKLYMQDLTHDDIEEFVTGRLEEHTRWTAIASDHSQGQYLVSEIVARSNGVFLWVVLVTKLLREGLTNRDSFGDLRRRVESFPLELEPFFKAMLEAVEPFYHSHMSTALQLATASGERQLNFLAFSFHFLEYEDSDYAINRPIRTMDEAEIQEMKNITAWRLESRTRGLLEVSSHDGTVTFLHRTVKDFLDTPEMNEFLIAKTDPRLKFHPHLSILKAYIAMIKASYLPVRVVRDLFGAFSLETRAMDTHSLSANLFMALNYASVIDRESHTTDDTRYCLLLDELDRCLIHLLSQGQDSCEFEPRDLSKMPQALLREQLVHRRVFGYLRRKVDSDPDFLKHTGPLPILQFFGQDSLRATPQDGGIPLLACLLDNRGIDPNKEGNLQGGSPWNTLLTHVKSAGQRKHATRILTILLEDGIIRLFLKAGADANADILKPTSTHNYRAASVVYLGFCFDVLEQSPPIQALYLDVLSEFLRLSSEKVLGDVLDTFCEVLSKRSKNELHWNLPFFANVNARIQLSLTGLGPKAAEMRQRLNEFAIQTFPPDLYTALEGTVAGPWPEEKRKRDSELDEPRKSQRLA